MLLKGKASGFHSVGQYLAWNERLHSETTCFLCSWKLNAPLLASDQTFSALVTGANAGRGSRGHFCCCTGLSLSWCQCLYSWIAKYWWCWWSSKLAGLGFSQAWAGSWFRSSYRYMGRGSRVRISHGAREQGFFRGMVQLSVSNFTKCHGLILRIESIDDQASQNLFWKLSRAHLNKHSEKLIILLSGYCAVILSLQYWDQMSTPQCVEWKPLCHIQIGTLAFFVSSCALASCR